MGQVDDIASNIYETEFFDEVATPQEIVNSKARISAWLETNIGQLNILINESFRVDGLSDVCPILKDEEIAIFIQLYLKYYYKRQSQSILKSAGGSVSSVPSTPAYTVSDWTELREGDSSIKRVAQTSSPQQRIQIAQTYRTFSQEADIKLSELVHSYNMYNSGPRQIVEESSASRILTPPTPT